MGEDKSTYKSARRKNGMSRKAERGGHGGFDRNETRQNTFGMIDGGSLNADKRFSKMKSTSTPQTSFIR